MLLRLTLLLSSVLLTTGTCWTQEDVPSLEIALKDKPFVLLNYSADSVSHFAWVNDHITNGTVVAQSFAAFTTKSINLQNGKIILMGEESILVPINGKFALRPEHIPTILEVDLDGTNIRSICPQILRMLFFPTLQTAYDALPPQIQIFIASPLNGGATLQKHERYYFDRGAWVKIPPDDRKFHLPTPIHLPDFRATDGGRKISGTIGILFEVLDNGRTDNFWLTKRLGQGSDEQAIKTVRSYRFKPAQYDGHPVGTVVRDEISITGY